MQNLSDLYAPFTPVLHTGFSLAIGEMNIRQGVEHQLSPDTRAAILQAQLVAQAKQYVGSKGRKYISPEKGMDEQGGFDCSGFVVFLLKKIGHSPSVRHANEFFDTWGVTVHQELHQPGDLVFFSNDGRYISHVGIMVGEGKYIHSPGMNGSHVDIKQLQQEEIPLRRRGQVFRTNPVGYKRLSIQDGRWRETAKGRH